MPYKDMASASLPYTKLVIISVHEFVKTKTKLQRKFMLMQIQVMWGNYIATYLSWGSQHTQMLVSPQNTWAEIFSVVVQLASLVTRIVVKTLTRWLRGTRYVTRHQMVNMQWFKCVVNKSKSAFWVDSVAARVSSCPQQSTKQHNKVTYAQNCHIFELCNVA